MHILIFLCLTSVSYIRYLRVFGGYGLWMKLKCAKSVLGFIVLLVAFSSMISSFQMGIQRKTDQGSKFLFYILLILCPAPPPSPRGKPTKTPLKYLVRNLHPCGGCGQSFNDLPEGFCHVILEHNDIIHKLNHL